MLFALAGTALSANAASAADVLSTTVSVGSAVDRSCTDKRLTNGEGYAQRSVTAPATGSVTARLDGEGAGDWDLAVFDGDSGRLVAGSAYSGMSEVAAGYAATGTRLVVQACRVAGGTTSASLSVDSTAIEGKAETASLVKVSTPNRARAQQLADLGLDLTEHGGEGFVEVVLHGAADAAKLRGAGFIYTVEIADLALQSRRDRRADAAFAAANARSELPSGQTTYRRLFDYSEDLKRLAREHPDLVTPITLPTSPTRAVPWRGSRSPRTRTRATASPSSCRWARITRVSGRRLSTRWSGRTS